jgi:hypothetical protein
VAKNLEPDSPTQRIVINKVRLHAMEEALSPEKKPKISSTKIKLQRPPESIKKQTERPKIDFAESVISET